MPNDYKYWAFISYSHQDKTWGDWLHKALETYRVPARLVGRESRDGKVPKRLFPIFRDREELPTSSDLGSNINDALKASRYLIVICSPKSAVSKWVNEEVKAFKAMGREDRILCLIVDGEPNATDRPGSGLLECFPEAVRYRVDLKGQITSERTEPIAADAREGKDGKADARLKVIAGLLGVGYDELKQREKQRQFWRRVNVGATLAILAAAIGGGWYWLDRQERIERLVELGRSEWLAQKPLRASAYLSAAYSMGGRSLALRHLLGQATLPVDILKSTLAGHEGSIYDARYVASGQGVVTFGNDGTARTWHADSGKLLDKFDEKPEMLLDLQITGKTSIMVVGGGHNGVFVTFGDLSVEVSDTGVLWRARVNSDGSRVLTVGHKLEKIGTRDTTYNVGTLIDLKSGRLLARLGEYRYEVQSADFSADGKLLLFASYAGVNVWEASSGRLLREIKANGLTSASFSADGGRIVTTGFDNVARVWDVATGKELLRLAGHEAQTNTAEFDRAGERIVTTSTDKTARIWDAREGKLLFTLAGHGGNVWRASFSPDGGRVLTIGDENVVRIWGAGSGALLAGIDGHTAKVTAAQFSPDGQRLLTAGEDGVAKIWEIGQGPALWVYPPGAQSISDDGRTLALSVKDQPVRIWSPAEGKVISTLAEKTRSQSSPLLSPDGSRVVTMGGNEAPSVWDARSGQMVSQLVAPDATITGDAFSPDGLRIATYGTRAIGDARGPERTVRIWDAASGKLLSALQVEDSPLRVYFSPDARRLVVQQWQSAELWDIESRRQIARLEGVRRSPPTFFFSRDGGRYVVKGTRGEAAIFDAASGRTIVGLAVASADIMDAVFNSGGTQVITAGTDNVIRIWDTGSGKPVRSLTAHTGMVWKTVFSADESRLLSLSQDNTAKLWDTESGKLVATLSGHSVPPTVGMFNPDGSLVITASGAQDPYVRVWEAATGRLLSVFGSHGGYLEKVMFNANGSLILATSSRRAMVWYIGLEQRAPEEIAAWVRCRVPWKLEGESLVQASPDSAACPKPAAAR